ncbi:prolipoprotein diacylglyceryl transferase [Anoxybacter fermentans]|uniref:Phosphatidylglycerol--prolipoprotein diacylglyceryl transferase n=1 Tax=Anoxybacter fermentans TaxID=1323375 RepID=A0A3Q9HSR7_9FIRM|nr:prolipoprotein diacylglyceryl transferase [Anoxybacter fermentans]
MDPIAFKIGPFAVHWYGILIGLGVLAAFFLGLREGKRRGYNLELFYDLIIYGVPAGIIGARLYYVIFRWEVYSDNPIRALYIWEGGLAIHGALIAAVIVGIFVTRYYKVNFWDIADIAAPGIILAQAIGRWGNYVNQEAYGYETDLPWAMYIDGAYRHPTFLYESIWNLLVFAFLLWLRRKKFIKTGEVFLAYLSLYSFGRFFIEGLRTDSLMLGPIRVAQLVSVLTIIGSITLIIYRRKAQVK